MGFKQVFYTLREVFPQVDLRILKAVASQYSSDVDAAVEFVLSDVLPAISEPTEARYTLQDIDYAKNDNKDSCTNGDFPEKNPFPGYGVNNNLDGCSNVEDKVVINETRITPIVDYDQIGASSVSATKPPIIDNEQSALRAFVNHCAMEKGNMSPHVEKLDNQKHLNGNYNLLDSLVSSGGILPLYDQSPSDCAVKHKGRMPLKVPKAESRQDFSESDDLGNLFANMYPTEDGHASANLLCAANMHRLSELRDNYELQVLFEKEMPLMLSKSEYNYKLDPYFSEFRSNKVIQTMDTLLRVPTVDRLSESESSYDLQVLFEEVPLRLSTVQHSHDISKSKDNYNFQVLLEENGNGGKELDLLHTAEMTPEPHKLEDNLHGKPCATDTTTQVTRFLIQDEYQQSSYKLGDQCSLSELFVSAKVVDNSLWTFEKKDNLHTADEGGKHDFTNALTLTDICSSNDDFYVSEFSSSTRNVSLSEDSECGVRDESERAIMSLDSADKHAIVPLILPDMDKHEEYLEITTQSYEIARIKKLISDVTNSKEELGSLYQSTRKNMNEVELQEENSRKAKQDAVEAHQGFVTMVENYNKLIENLKESNDKKAEIMCGEKSALTTLAQDLQSRLSKLSAERDDVLTIVEKIQSELDARLATSIEEETAAREHISQVEELALLVRREKEAEMESIVEESMKLQKEAEQNILLRKFLTDRGHVIDILQGEISSIHAKVVALKERTHRSNPQSVLVTTSSSATSSNMPECETPPDRHRQFENPNNSGILTQEKMVGSHAKYHEGLSDDEWEMLETTQA